MGKSLSAKFTMTFIAIVLQFFLPQSGWAAEVVEHATNQEGEIVAASDAQKMEFGMGEVVITATRILQEAKKVPASVTVITAQQIKEMNIMTVDEALRNSAGIFVDRPKGISGVGDGIMMRGFGDSNVLALLDGQPMNLAYDGAINWNAIPVESVERIEVVRGGASSLYGGYAVGGVINIITKDPKDTSVSANVFFGSEGTWRKSLNINQKLSDKFSLGAGYESRSTDGHAVKPASSTASPKTGAVPTDKPQGTGVIIGQTVGGDVRYIFGSTGKNAYDGDTYWLKMKYEIDENKAISYNYTRDKFEYRYDNPQTYIYDNLGNPIYNGYAVLPDGRYFAITESNFTDYLGRRTADIHAFRYHDQQRQITLNAGLTDTKENGYSTGSTFDKSQAGSDTSYPSKTWNIDLQKVWNNIGKNTIVAGFNWRSDEMNQHSAKLAHWNDPNSVTAFTTVNGGKGRLLAAFIQDEYQMDEQWKLFGGLRYDSYKKYDGYSQEFKTNGIDKQFAADTYNELSPKIALEYLQNEDTTYYASYGHSFNPPSLYKLYRWTTATAYDSPANPNLKPETSDTFEIGVKKQLDKKTNMNIALYQTKTDDVIARVAYKAGDYLPAKEARVYENLDSATRKGIEIDLTHKLSDKWDVYTNYAWQKGTYHSAVSDTSFTTISAIPTHLLHFGGNYRYGKWTGNFGATYVSERNEDDSVTGVYGSKDSYFTVNTRINYAIKPNMTVVFGIDNLFDREYSSYYAASGRTYNLGMQYNF